MDGRRRKGLVDTGCSVTLVSAAVARNGHSSSDGVRLETMSGGTMRTLGSYRVESLVVGGRELGPVKVQMLQTLPLGVDTVLGLDLVLNHGLQVYTQAGKAHVVFGDGGRKAAVVQSRREPSLAGSMTPLLGQTLKVGDKDFDASFDGAMKWVWKGQCTSLSCKRPNYAVPEADRGLFDEEVKSWVSEGILVPWSETEHGPVMNVVPMMSVRQVKGEEHKIRPILDLRELNKNVMCLSGGTPTCEERLKEWRCLGNSGSVLDLKRAYLQIHVARELWVDQAVRWRGKMYLLTRMGFGMNVAPRVMTAIVEKVLATDEEIRASSSSYVDDIFVTGGAVMSSG